MGSSTKEPAPPSRKKSIAKNGERKAPDAKTTNISNRSIQLLVGTANLGNAPPNRESVGAWIPFGGLLPRSSTKGVVMDPKRAPSNPTPSSDQYGQLGEDEPSSSSGTMTRQRASSTSSWELPLDDEEDNFTPSDRILHSTSAVRKSTGSLPLTRPAGGRPQRKKSIAGSCDAPTLLDVIVIGLQEATFSEKAKKHSILTEEEDEDSEDEDAGLQLNHSESENDPLDFDFDAVAPTYMSPTASTPNTKKKKSISRELLKTGYKAGKAGLKAGYKASKKVTQKTTETIKTVNTLASYKDHSDKVLPVFEDTTAANTAVASGTLPTTWSSTDILHYRFAQQLPEYQRAGSYQLGEMRLLIYYHPKKVKVKVEQVSYKPTGKGGRLANKGGIVTQLAVAGIDTKTTTRLSFVTAHLEAHEGEEKYQTRIASFRDILSSTKTGAPTKLDVMASSHFVFWMGDLNFRTRIPKVEPGSERHIRIAHNMAKARDWRLLNKYDELGTALRQKECLTGFRTPYCAFDPTFKVARGTRECDYHPHRSPSYTDRILFKTADQLEPNVKPILYQAIPEFTTSDHKPVRAAFSIKLNEGIPIASAAPTTTALSPREMHWNRGGGKQGCRRTMHILVSSMSAMIDPSNYDTIRKMEKAELPHSYLEFSGNNDAVLQLVVEHKQMSLWRQLDWSSGQIAKYFESKGKKHAKVSSKGCPRTVTSKDTMKPRWTGENRVHLALSTHTESGKPRDLSGVLWHITLFDKKEDKAIATSSINLAHWISLTQNPSLISSRNSGGGGRGSPAAAQIGPARRPTNTNTGGTNMPTRRSGTSENDTTGSTSRGVSRKKSGDTGPLMATVGGRGPPQRTYSGGALRGPPQRTPSGGALPSSPPPPRGSLKHVTVGPSKSMCDLVATCDEAPASSTAIQKRLQDLKVVSVQIDGEPMYEGGLEVARLKCTVDVWWVAEDE